MENRFEQTPPEEREGWGAYATPPATSGHSPLSSSGQLGLCKEVRDLLPLLIEGGGEVRPEMVATVTGHLGICPTCSRDFKEMQRVVMLLDTLPAPQMVQDYSMVIMRRIQAQGSPQSHGAVPRLDVATSNGGVGRVGPLERGGVSRSGTENIATSTVGTTRRHKIIQTQNKVTAQQVQRVTAAGVVAGMLAFFLSTEWGREALGGNLESAGEWLRQIGDALAEIPGLHLLIASVMAVLGQAGILLHDTFRTAGSAIMQGVAIDVGLLGASYYYLGSRRRRTQMSGF